MKWLLEETVARSARYAATVGRMRVAPRPEDIARLKALGGALPQHPSDPKETLALCSALRGLSPADEFNEMLVDFG
jgi:hypothetical protein